MVLVDVAGMVLSMPGLLVVASLALLVHATLCAIQRAAAP